MTNFDRNPVFVFQIFQASKDIKRYQKISKVSAQDYFESISSATDSIQKSRLTAIPNKSVAFSAPGLSPVTFRAVQPGCRRQRQAQSSMLFAECVQPPKEKKTHKIRCISMYFYYVHLCALKTYLQFLPPPMASYGLCILSFRARELISTFATKQLMHFVYYGQLRANTWHIELNIFGVPKNVRRLQCRLEILEILAPLIFPSDGCRLQNERNRLATLWVLYATPSCTLSQNLPVGPIVDRFPT